MLPPKCRPVGKLNPAFAFLLSPTLTDKLSMEEQIASVAISAADVYLISSKSKDIKLAYAQFKVNQTALSNHVLLNDFRSKEFGAFLSDRKDSTALMLCLFASGAQDLKLPSLIRLTAGLLTLECLLTAATSKDVYHNHRIDF